MSPPDVRRFFTETIPAQFNKALDAQEQLGEAGHPVLDDMRAASGTLRVEVTGSGTFFLNIEAGRMTTGDTPRHPPFLSVLQDQATFERLFEQLFEQRAAEAGDSPLALPGSLPGLAGEIKLTRTRIENLSAVRGLIRFEVAGKDGFCLQVHFGPDPFPEEPHTSIRVDAAAYREIRAGKLDAQSAFLTGQIQIEGDVQLAMQLALAAIAADRTEPR